MHLGCINDKFSPLLVLCKFQTWTAASLLKHRLDHNASLTLAKHYLNFDCKKGEVDYIYSMLRSLKKIFLYRTGNYNDSGSPKASKSSNRINSCTGVAQVVELFKKDMSKSIKEIRKKCEKRLKKLSLKQQEAKQKLREDIEVEKAEFERKYKIELAFICSCSSNDVMRTEKLKVLNSEYEKRIAELKSQHETCLKVLEDKQLAQMLKFQDMEAAWVEEVKSWAQNELLNIDASMEFGTRVEYLQVCDQVQSPHGPKNHFAGVKGRDNMVESMTKTGTGVPETNSPAVVLCNSTVEQQNPLVKHVGANEMGIMVSEDRPVSGSEDHNITENRCDSQGNAISKHSHSREQNSDGAMSMTDEDNGCKNVSHGSRDGCRDDTVILVPPSSNGEICVGETSDVPNREGAREFCKTSSPNGEDEIHSSTQRKLGGTMSSMSGCGFLLEVKANGLSDGTENIASMNSQSPEKHMPTLDAMCSPDCENATQIHVADCNGSNNSVNVNSPLFDERIGDRAIISALDREAPLEMPGNVNITNRAENVISVNPLSSMEQISDGGAVNEFPDKVLSRSCGTASPSNGPDNVTLLNPHVEHRNSDGVSSSVPEGKFPVEVQETTNEGDCASVLERQVPVQMPVTVNSTNCLQNATPLNPPSSVDQISGRSSLDIPVLDSVLSSRPCSLLNPPLQQQIPDGDIPVTVPENSHAVADCHKDTEPSTNAVLVDKSTTCDQEEGVPRTVTKYTLSEETLASGSVNVMEPLERGQQLSSVESPFNQDSAGEMLNSSEQVELASGSEDVLPANQPIQPKQVHQLPAAELTSNLASSNFPLATEVEQQPINVSDLPRHHPEASTVVSNQDVVQPHSNSVLDTHSHQVAMHPASNSDLDSQTAGRVRVQSSNPRNLSTPLEMNNHPLQTAPHSASRMLPHLCYDPLKNELERLQKAKEQTLKNHDDMVSFWLTYITLL